jgi:uncharacterized protein (UPF0333 family)
MNKGPSLKKGIQIWGFLVTLGVVAYGIGLYYGSSQRNSRSIASVYVISNTPDNIVPPTSPTK